MKLETSIIVPIHNGEQYINECVLSILHQIYRNYELILVDDFSTDKTMEMLKRWEQTDSRIVVVKNLSRGIVNALNLAISISSGRYLVRMDIDDLMLKDRLQKQVSYMNKHADVVVCGSWARVFGKSEGVLGGGNEGVVKNVIARLLLGNFIVHPTTIIRKDFLMTHGLRYKEYPHAEDYKLWFDVAKRGGVFSVIPECLLNYRNSENQVSYKFRQEQEDTTLRIKNEILDYALDKGLFPDGRIRKVLDYLSEYNAMNYVSDIGIFRLCSEILILYAQSTKEK